MKNKLVFVWVAVVCVVGLAAPAFAQDAPLQRPPIIDMHLHAVPAKGWPGGPSKLCPGAEFGTFDPKQKWDPDRVWETCPNPVYPVATDEEVLRQTLATMDRYNVVLAATSGPLEHVRRYRKAAPQRILPGLSSAVGELGSPGSLRELIRKSEIAVLGEIGPAIEGISPADEVLEPYLALAEELDVPLALHMLSFQSPYMFPQNRAALNNPLLLEKMLIRHPKLRVGFLESGGGWIAPWLDRMDRHFDDQGFNDSGLKTRPSELFQRNCWISFEPVEGSIKVLAEYIGPHKILWATDYPHRDGFFPGAPQMIKDRLIGAPPEVTHQVLAGGAMGFYGLN